MTARRTLVLGIATLFFLVIGCGGGGGSGSAAGSNTWVGKLDETDAYVAMLIKDTTRYVYVTDGKDVNYLFSGQIGETDISNYFTLRDEQNHVVNVQAPQGSIYKGLITAGPGKYLSFSVAPAKGEAGLYRAKDGTDQSRWIVLEDASFRGAKVSADGKTEGLATLGGVKWTDPTTDP